MPTIKFFRKSRKPGMTISEMEMEFMRTCDIKWQKKINECLNSLFKLTKNSKESKSRQNEL